METRNDCPQEGGCAATATVGVILSTDTGTAPIEPLRGAVPASAKSRARDQRSIAAKVSRGREGSADAPGDGAAGGDAKSPSCRPAQAPVVRVGTGGDVGICRHHDPGTLVDP